MAINAEIFWINTYCRLKKKNLFLFFFFPITLLRWVRIKKIENRALIGTLSFFVSIVMESHTYNSLDNSIAGVLTNYVVQKYTYRYVCVFIILTSHVSIITLSFDLILTRFPPPPPPLFPRIIFNVIEVS